MLFSAVIHSLPMKHTAHIIVLSLLVPIAALALDFGDYSKVYTDAPFSKPEAAGISLLTDMHVVSGNPDGSFAPRRTLNRAEFVKIALLSVGATGMNPGNCFPDVHVADWFSQYVCEARLRNIVQGYPDGFFHPERPVNYVEALKILTVLYGYDVQAGPREDWYVQYVRAARGRGTLLPSSVEYGDALTRGEMARLTAGFIAESLGELENYRRVEQGQLPVSSSSSLSVSSSYSSSSSSSSSSMSSSSSSSSVARPDFPAKNRMLLLGTARTEPLIGTGIMSLQEDIIITSVRVDFTDELDSIDSLYLIDEFGTTLGSLSLDPYDNTREIWVGNFPSSGSGAYRVKMKETRVFGIVGRVKAPGEGGATGEYVRFDNFMIFARGVDSQTGYDSGTLNFTPPEHRTVQARITSVTNAGPANSVLAVGPGQTVAEFAIAGTALPGVTPRVTSFQFQLAKSWGVTLQNWKLRSPDTNTTHDCSVSGTTVSCSAIPTDLGIFSTTPREVHLSADVSVDTADSNRYLQVNLYDRSNAIWWTDGGTSFSWVELPTPVATGTLWK